MTRAAAACVGLCLISLLGCRNKPPAVSTPSGPASLRTGSAGTFSATANDPEASAVALRFHWGDSDTSPWSGWLSSGDTATASHAWTASGSYEVRAQAKDVHELLSAWSAPLAVLVSDTFNRAPLVSLSGPDSGFIGIAYTFFATATDPDADSVFVRFCCDHGDTTQWAGPLPSGTSLAYPDSWTTGGSHWVAAQTKDAFGLQSAWSALCTIGISVEGTLRWRAEAYCFNNSCPAVGPDGTIYVSNDDLGLQALSAGGSFIWGVPFDAYTTPALANDRIYVGGRDQTSWFMAAFTTSGTELWRHRVRDDVFNAPAVSGDGTVYFTSEDSVFALNPNGTVRWAHDCGFPTWSSCALGPDGTVYTGVGQDSLFAFNPDGSVKWRTRAPVGSYFALAIGADGTLYFGSRRNSQDGLLALNPDGTDKWHCPTQVALETAPVIGPDGTLYAAGGNGKLVAVSPTGTLKWTFTAQDRGDAGVPLVRADSVVCYTVGDCGLFALNPDGTLRWTARAGEGVGMTPFAIAADGTLLYPDNGGYVNALFGSSPLADSPWPKFQRDLENSGRAR